MLSLEREVLAAPIAAEAKARIAAIERREIVSVRPELRALLWLGVALISGGVGTLLARNIERIGHVTLIVAIAVAAAGCYLFAWKMRRSESGRAQRGPAADPAVAQEPEAAPHLAGEYVLLLGALLLSADVAYAEAQLKILGDAWRWHLVILAVVHGATAYAYASRKVLSLAIVALAGVFGVDRSGALFTRGAGDAAARLASAAAAVAVWRVVHERASRLRSFGFTLEQAAFHLAMIASLTAMFDDALVWIALPVALALAALGALHAVRTREESFLVFAIVYAVIAIDIAVVPRFSFFMFAQGWILATSAAGVALLYFTHRWWKERFA
ncbi:MAG TPA: DUF2157 domain-containing protein [Thermoanaerobaculia bacterium]